MGSAQGRVNRSVCEGLARSTCRLGRAGASAGPCRESNRPRWAALGRRAPRLGSLQDCGRTCGESGELELQPRALQPPAPGSLWPE